MLKSIVWDIGLLLLVFFVAGCIIGCVARRNWAMFFGASQHKADAPASKPAPSRLSSPADHAEAVQPDDLQKPRGGGADDLKQISGVGPVLEKKLNGLGCYHFDQIAAWTPQNVDWVDAHLNFKGRVARDKWIEQANRLMK